MAATVRVRLVPKNSSGGSIPRALATSFNLSPKTSGPELGRGQEAFRRAMNLGVGMTGQLSQRGVMNADLPVEQFERVFKTSLGNTPAARPEAAEMATAASSHLLPTSALVVPDELAEVIDFAYVPTPPQFFSLNPIPPNPSVYHLRVEDVARLLNAYRCHRLGWTGRGVRIAMTDSGFGRHPFFEQYGFDIQRVNTPLTSHPETDASGHGTGESANCLVIAPDCSFVGVKHDDYSAEALETAIATAPRIITNSWGWNIDTQSLSSLQASDPNQFNEITDIANIIGDAVEDGIAVVFSGGNGHLAFPACLPDVIAVGGAFVDAAGGARASSYASSFISQLYPSRRVPDICGIVGDSGTAPLRGHIMLPVPNGSELEGENLPQSAASGGWGIFSGTSAAAPQVAGLIALMLSVHGTLTPAEIKSILQATARDVIGGSTAHGETAVLGADLATGSGLVDALQACMRVRQLYPQ